MVAATFQPFFIKYFALASPIPLEVPVIRTVRLMNSIPKDSSCIHKDKLWTILHSQEVILILRKYHADR